MTALPCREVLCLHFTQFCGCEKFLVVPYGIHKSQKVKDWLVRHPKFTLLFLPVYSPWLNKIERLWQSLHETITRNHCCQFMWQLLNYVDAFLVSFSSQQKPGRQKMGVAQL